MRVNQCARPGCRILGVAEPARSRISISAELLHQQRRKLGPMLFAQEYEGEFIDAESSAFSSEMIERALVDDFERFP